ncbi:MAG: NUDIX hydrolase [Phototrophicaceae bacterium]
MSSEPHRPRHIVAVSALVRNAHGDVLLIRSPRRGWEFPGGQVEEGETLTGALRREILEETGVTATIGSLVGIYSNVMPPVKVMFGFLAEYTGGDLKTSDESLETVWLKPGAVVARITHPAVRDRMQDMLIFKGRVIYRVYTNAPYHVLEEFTL